jgi:hypothetical protein
MSLEQRARRAFADAVEGQGPCWRNAADSIRAGWGNTWVAAGIAALERVLRHVPDEDDEE